MARRYLIYAPFFFIYTKYIHPALNHHHIMVQWLTSFYIFVSLFLILNLLIIAHIKPLNYYLHQIYDTDNLYISNHRYLRQIEWKLS